MIMRTQEATAGAMAETMSADRGKPVISHRSVDRRMEVAFALRQDSMPVRTGSGTHDRGRVLLGDDGEWNDSLGQACMGNAVFIEYDLRAKTLKLITSIVGLPPVFVYKDAEMVVVTSALYLLTLIPGVRLYFDPAGVNDTCSVGHPVDHRTLFKDVAMLPCGHQVTVDANGIVGVSRAWTLPDTEPLHDWNSYTDLQMEIFKDALGKLDLTTSFLSLTAGLDTRAILADLIFSKRVIPAYTMSGTTVSLDAAIARNLYGAYGLQHTVIVLNDEFRRDLPDLAYTASRLSGGLSSLGQAHEIYLYKKIPVPVYARLSGNLGNQIGRRGTERISMLNADATILHGDISRQREKQQRDHWYDTSVSSEDGKPTYEFLLQSEIPFSSVGNYSIGNHFAVQQSPYANRMLIEAAQRKPDDRAQEKSVSLVKMRLNDLRHRFMGESEEQSFQVKLIKRVGGHVASYPINWGWRARGGVSLKGLFYGGLSFIDALVCSRGLDRGMIYQGLKAMRIAGLHEYRSCHEELQYLREFVHDTLSSASVRRSGLFHNKRITEILKEHYVLKKYHHKEITLALDLALAQRIFKADLH